MRRNFRRPKVALVHDHLVQDGGAEQVLRELMRIWPDAPVYTAYYDPRRMGPDFRRTGGSGRAHTGGKDIRTSYLQRLPLARRFYKWTLPLIDGAFRRFDLSEYDVVVSSASAWAKSVRTGPDTLHVCYCHTPTRYLWSDADRYIGETGYPRVLKSAFRGMLGRLRKKDLRGARGVDAYVANSRYVADRIKKYYRRPSVVIHPPVDSSKFGPSRKRGDYFLLAGRLEPYKRGDIVIEAANRLGARLVVMGDGTDRRRLEKLAGPTVEFTGRVSDARRKKLFAEADALINPQEEDFGITVVEALASGAPVLAYRRGGAAEIVTARAGAFFERQTPDAVAAALRRFKPQRYRKADLTARARDFSAARFRRALKTHVDAELGSHADRR
ncbi:MAG: glycosyltransferase [bacterium]|nr:glycosyltransferase [bacterium]MDZ4248266.1 glycosyltransferase [Patescibacteria group bacterium]